MPTETYSERTRVLTFGTLLKNHRISRGLSQKDVAARLTSSGHATMPNGVAQLELGRVTNPDDKAIVALAAVYGLPYGDLLAALIRDKYPTANEGTTILVRRGGLSIDEVLQKIRTIPDRRHGMSFWVVWRTFFSFK